MSSKEIKHKKLKKHSSKQNVTDCSYKKVKRHIASPSSDHKKTFAYEGKLHKSMEKLNETPLDPSKYHLNRHEKRPWDNFIRELHQLTIQNDKADISKIVDEKSEDENTSEEYDSFLSRQVSTIFSDDDLDALPISTSMCFEERCPQRVFEYLESLDVSGYELRPSESHRELLQSDYCNERKVQSVESTHFNLAVSESELMSTSKELVCKCSSENKPHESDNFSIDSNEKFIARTLLLDGESNMYSSTMRDRSPINENGAGSDGDRPEQALQTRPNQTSIGVTLTQTVPFDLSESNASLEVVESFDVGTDEKQLDQQSSTSISIVAEFSEETIREQISVDESVRTKEKCFPEIQKENAHNSLLDTKLRPDAGESRQNLQFPPMPQLPLCEAQPTANNQPKSQITEKNAKLKKAKNRSKSKPQQQVIDAGFPSKKVRSPTNKNTSKKLHKKGLERDLVERENETSLSQNTENDIRRILSYTIQEMDSPKIARNCAKSINKTKRPSPELDVAHLMQVIKSSISETLASLLKRKTRRTRSACACRNPCHVIVKRIVPKSKPTEERGVQVGRRKMVEVAVNTSPEIPPTTEDRGVQFDKITMVETATNTCLEDMPLEQEAGPSKTPCKEVKSANQRKRKQSTEQQPKTEAKPKRTRAVSTNRKTGKVTMVDIGINTSLENIKKARPPQQEAGSSKTPEIKKTIRRKISTEQQKKARAKVADQKAQSPKPQTENPEQRRSHEIQSTITQCLRKLEESKASAATTNDVQFIPITVPETPRSSHRYFQPVHNLRKFVVLSPTSNTCIDTADKLQFEYLKVPADGYRITPIICTPSLNASLWSIPESDYGVSNNRACAASDHDVESTNVFFDRIDRLRLSDVDHSSSEIVPNSQQSTTTPTVTRLTRECKQRVRPYPQYPKIQPPLTRSRTLKTLQPIESHDSERALLDPIMIAPLNDPDIYIEEHLEYIGKRFNKNHENRTLPTLEEMYGRPMVLTTRDIEWKKLLHMGDENIDECSKVDAEKIRRPESNAICRVSWPFCSSVKSSQEPESFSPNLSPVSSK
ncbi:uncharacterized protein LOC129777479 [Toxorhynchites rutilus septentrionalis]|uniref:uncharacterized protein LOC129777479 n=1 Tax=Toxorhynchites rutilus septentrionalis TaxID=329112 RepID=UPI002479F3AF|nr:uncharacterized protein LOC129777479 [Toxorhynchites rutilus septentrionalis]